MTIYTDGMTARPRGISEIDSGLGGYLGAKAADAAADWPVQRLADIGELRAASGERGGFGFGSIPAGDKPEILSLSDANAKLKAEGVDHDVKLTIDGVAAPALDIMIARAKAKREREATIARGPDGILQGALGVGTSFLVGAVDPLNIAASFIPVVGEIKYAKQLADAGVSTLARAGVRARVGALEGAVGQAVLEPINAWATTQEGGDYTLASALNSVMFGAALGTGLRTGGGAIADAIRMRRGRPLFPFDVGEHADTHPALSDIFPPKPYEPLAARPESPFLPGRTQPFEDVIKSAREQGDMSWLTTPIDPAELERIREKANRASPHVEALDDLPPRAKEDLTRIAVAGLVNGEPVKVGEVLNAAAANNPRIAESLDLVNRPEVRVSARRVHDDVASQLTSAGMSEPEAKLNGALMAARYAARAQRIGRDAHELYQADGVVVRKGESGPGAGMTLDQAKRRPPGPDLFSQREAEGQQQLPGTDRIGQGELAQRRANESLKPGVAQKPMDVGLFGDDAKQKTLFQSQPTAPTFFSAVLRTIETGKQSKASPDQWLATIKNTPGVKPEEMEWLGLADWLKQQKGSVTKEQVAEYVRANQIEVKEVTKGEYTEGAIETDAWEAREEPNGSWNAYNRETGEPFSFGTTVNDREWAEETANNLNREQPQGQPTKFSGWQMKIPGATNYRELLLTLPERETGAPSAEVLTAAKAMHSRASIEDWNDLMDSERRGYIDRARKSLGAGDQDFRGSHWNEPNVLAHVRFNDRTIDGKRTLFVEEIQSDWHQQGRTRSYGEPPPIDTTGWTVHSEQRPRDWGPVGTYEARIVRDAQGRDVWTYTDPGDTPPEGLIANAAAIIARDRPKGVPDAPFKTTWPELSLKRMIRYAAENGYDQIAWTPGHVQAERYDLSKQISEISYNKTTLRLMAKDHNGSQVMSEKSLPNELADKIGKETAERLLNEPTQIKQIKWSESTQDVHYLSGLDLKVGGEGMHGFYDKILPAAANKLVKKYAARVGEAELKSSGGEEHASRITELDRQSEEARARGDRQAESLLAMQRLELFAEHGKHHEPVTVHTLPITPELRDAAVSQGFPLFQKSGESEPRGRITLSENNAIIDLFNSADKSTFLHEAGHLFLDQLARDAQLDNVPQALKDDLGTVLRWLGVSKVEDIGVPEHEQWARGFEQYLASGEAPSNALVKAFQAFKEWLGAIYRSLRDLGQPLPDDIRAVMDRMLATDAEIAERRAPRTREEAWAELSRRESDQVQSEPGKVEHPASLQPQEIDTGLGRELPKAADVAAPEQPKPLTPVSASAKAAAKAEQLAVQEYEAAFAAGDVTAEDRVSLDNILKAIDAEADARARVVREGAGCLAGGFGFAATAPAKSTGDGAKSGFKIALPRDGKGRIAGAHPEVSFVHDPKTGMINGVNIG